MSRIGHDEFLELESLDALMARYRELGFEGDDEALLLEAQRDWHEVALAKARAVTEAPPRFLPDSYERGGVRYDVYGVIHGLFGGEDRDYKAFVDAPLGELEVVLFENGLSYFYPHADQIASIPDFVVLGAGGSLRTGLYVGLRFPLLLWEALRELVKAGRSGEDGQEVFDYDPRYHALDLETRRGVEPDPPLPSRLQIEYELRRWDAAGRLAGWSEPFAIVPRSMFMAGFAEGYATSRGLSSVALVVGDLHTAELLAFMRDPALEHPLFW